MLARQLAWELGPTGTQASLRGLSAPTDNVVWACGGGSTVVRSSDTGSSWEECGPAQYGQLEFRSIYAWDAQTACIASAGTPAIILRTTSGGEHWQEVYRHESQQAFFDGLRFWNEQDGLACSDPVDGKLLIVETRDGGRSWKEVDKTKLPAALDGEAAFAASNSSLCLSLDGDGQVWIGTGGASQASSRIYYRAHWNADWKTLSCPLPSGPSQGVFSMALGAGRTIVAVGGDYRPDVESLQTAAVSVDGGHSWRSAQPGPSEYRSAIVKLPSSFGRNETFIATGPTGSDVSLDGEHWQQFSDQGFHTLASTEKHVFAAGADGRFAVLKVNK